MPVASVFSLVDLRYEVLVIERSDAVGVSSVEPVIKLQNSFLT